ncbi:hypothetical protein DYD21_09190 [Rhodohalobacter sp. SW132]|nr:hypothetical protein [Rhodohalobacter sp. SW132]REL33575.1 hypothetical protein DYD21_09190 [Rhodohalobacter sp. SW132]
MLTQAAAPSYSQSADLDTLEVTLADSDTTFFLGFLIDWETVEVMSDDLEINSDWWTFDPHSGMISFHIPEEIFLEYTEVAITYEKPLFDITQSFRLREFQVIDDTLQGMTGIDEPVRRQILTGDDLFGEADLSQSGSLTRGFTVGNRQDLALDSGLRLDLSGNITDEITILASLTDRSTPIQPDGTTQTIREFDRVYIQLQAPVGELELGDVDIRYDQSRFARINRRVQGAVGSGTTPVGDFGGGASVARGQFRTQRFNGLEGVQGPYRLSGAENEAFIIVIAGSETVYIDGNEVNRGAENEYIIDYSLGEITFTNNLVVTDETRIVVEFQYITQNFTRTLFTARGSEDNLAGGRLSVGATYIREADNKNPATQLNLSDEDIDRLRNLGDDQDELFVSGADSVGFREDAQYLQYARVDTVYNGEVYEIFRHLPGDPRGVYRVRFSNLGEGNGSYRRVGGAVNGILYEWAGPGQGRYEPVIRLQAPKSHQMVSLNSSFQLSEHIQLSGEWAISEFDPNRFSETGSGNVDHAVNGELSIAGIESRMGTFDAGIEQNYIGEQFEFFDRPRVIEFDRRWNIQREEDGDQERETTIYAGLTRDTGSRLRLNAGELQRNRFEGRRAEGELQLQESGVPQIFTTASYVNSRDEILNRRGDWLRNRGTIRQDFSVNQSTVTPFFHWEAENRDQRTLDGDLLSESLQFYDLNPGLQLQLSSLMLEGGLGYRRNRRPLDNQLADESVSRSQRFRMEYRPSDSFRTENSVQFRQKTFENEFQQESAAPRSRGVLMRSATNYSLLNNLADGELFYEANTERRALLQETYIEVGPELGQYVWIDLNEDGVRQVDEFFPEVTPNEGTYIRQFVPSDELLPVIDVTLRARNEFRIGEMIAHLRGRDTGALEHLVLRSLFEIRETSREEELRKVYFLNRSVLLDEETSINGQQFFRQRLSWRSEERTAEASMSYNQSNSLFQRAAGVQTAKNREMLFEGELQVSRPLRLLSQFRMLESENQNSRFSSRNFNISGFEAEPGFSLFINRSAQTEFRTLYGFKRNRAPGGDASARTISVENRTQLFLFNRIQNRLRLQLRRTIIDGPAAGQAEFELTDGIGTGTNIVWSLNSDYRATSLVRLSLQYNGRTTAQNQIIQTLRLVVSAVF